jgi:hypothetical protein
VLIVAIFLTITGNVVFFSKILDTSLSENLSYIASLFIWLFDAHLDFDEVNDRHIAQNAVAIVPSVSKQNWTDVQSYPYFALGIHPWMCGVFLKNTRYFFV